MRTSFLLKDTFYFRYDQQMLKLKHQKKCMKNYNIFNNNPLTFVHIIDLLQYQLLHTSYILLKLIYELLFLVFNSLERSGSYERGGVGGLRRKRVATVHILCSPLWTPSCGPISLVVVSCGWRFL